jgi:hypothetical protein
MIGMRRVGCASRMGSVSAKSGRLLGRQGVTLENDGSVC